ncbi:MAG: winged helix-turn-helix domain-containing protein [Terriglobales bacterium]
MSSTEQPPFHFGVFELDLATGELRKSGVKIHLQPQPLRVLTLLVNRPGQMVTREELQREIWGNDTFVDFEQGLNFCIRKIRETLGDAADTPRYIETLPRRGYRFVAPVTVGGDRAGAQALIETQTSVTAPAVAPRSRRTSLIAAALLTLVALAGYSAWRHYRLQPEPPAAPKARVMLAVLPFANLSGQEEEEYLSEGLTAEMIAELGSLYPRGLGVIASNSVARYRTRPAPIEQVGRELHVEYVLEGSVHHVDNRVRVIAELIRVRDQTLLWSKTYEGDLSDILSWQQGVARATADELRLALPLGPQVTRPNPRPINPEAYRLYLKGEYFTKKGTGEDMIRARRYFEKAIGKDPGSALPYVGLSHWNFVASHELVTKQEAEASAREYANKALQVDPYLAAAHTQRATIAYELDWDWPTAEREFARAMELNPGDSFVRREQGLHFLVLGKLPEALAEFRRAQELDPLMNRNAGLIAYMLALQHRHDEALRELQAALELEPDSAYLHGTLGEIYDAAGMYDRAILEQERAVALWGPQVFASKPLLACHYARAGRRREALKLLEELEGKYRQGRCPATFVA